MTTPTPLISTQTASNAGAVSVSDGAVPPNLNALTVEQVGEHIRVRLSEYLAESGIEFTEHIGDDMSFDYIGLDSLARVNLMTALDKEFGVRLDPAAAFDFVTVGSLAKFVWSEVTGTPLDLKTVLEV